MKGEWRIVIGAASQETGGGRDNALADRKGEAIHIGPV